MNTKQLLTSLIIILLATSCSQQKHISTKWQKDEYHQSENIPRLNYWYNKDSKILYLVTNDNKNLYIHLKAIDNTSQKKILNFGFTVWVDTQGKNKKQLGIKYPLAKADRMPPLQIENQQNRNRLQPDNSQLLNQSLQIELIGFNNTKESDFILAKNNSDINGEMNFLKNGELQYLLTIPYKRLGIDINNSLISLNMESGSLDIDNYSQRPSGGGGMNGGKGTGGGRKQGMGGGRQGGSGNPEMRNQMIAEKQELSTPIKIKIKKIKLFRNDLVK